MAGLVPAANVFKLFNVDVGRALDCDTGCGQLAAETWSLPVAEISFDRDFRTALQIDESFLRRLFSIVTEFVADSAAKIILKTDGDLTIASTDLDEVLASDLVQTDTIKRIEVAGSRHDDGLHQSISFEVEKDASWRTCSIRIHGQSTDKVTAFKSRLEALIKSGRLWYSIFRPHGPGGAALVSLSLCTLVYCLGWVALIGLKIVVIKNWVSFAITFFADFITVAIILTYLTKRVFPGVVFDFGLSGRRAQSAATIRNIIFVVVGLGLAVSIAANVIYEMIKR